MLFEDVLNVTRIRNLIANQNWTTRNTNKTSHIVDLWNSNTAWDGRELYIFFSVVNSGT